MDEKQLYRKLVKLAYAKPEHRAKLLPIIKAARSKKAREAPDSMVSTILSALGAIQTITHFYSGDPVMKAIHKEVIRAYNRGLDTAEATKGDVGGTGIPAWVPVASEQGQIYQFLRKLGKI